MKNDIFQHQPTKIRMINADWVIKVENLVKKFGDFTAVDNISFTIKRGEIFGFLGPNGAGKSTTIRILCGLLSPTSGSTWVSNYDVATESDMVKKNIGYMSQKFSLYDDLTVEENINFFSGIYGVPHNLRNERKEYVLYMAGIKEHRTTMTRFLAGGWKQRLALGCALLHQPPVLFLDEPTSGVDPIARREFWDLIYQLSESGHTVFVTTHYMDEAEYCHRLALMYRGKIIAEGTPSSLKETLRGRYLMHLDCSDPLESMRVLDGEDGILDVAVFGGGLHVTVQNPDTAAPQIQNILGQHGIKIGSLETIQPLMEDVFVSMIEEEDKKLL